MTHLMKQCTKKIRIKCCCESVYISVFKGLHTNKYVAEYVGSAMRDQLIYARFTFMW
jgi:hypothetical protein